MINIPSLETNIVNYCNNHCASCNHMTVFTTKPVNLEPEDLWSDLLKLAPMLHAERFVLIGGEPTLHPDLEIMMRVVKESGISDRLVMYTNGFHLLSMSSRNWEMLDELFITLYPNSESKLGVNFEANVNLKASELGLKVTWQRLDTFYPLFTRSDRTPSDTQNTFDNCPYARMCRIIEDGYIYNCPQSTFFPDKIMGLPAKTDGLRFDVATEAQLAEHLFRQSPLRSCARCNYHGSKPWQQSDNLQAWMKESSE